MPLLEDKDFMVNSSLKLLVNGHQLSALIGSLKKLFYHQIYIIN
jgi:hypothetical protein